MPTLGTDNNNNLALTFYYYFGGDLVAWGQPYRVNGLSNSAESIDGNYRISDLDFQLVDINGSYFATQFGRGTRGLGSSLQVVVGLGGDTNYFMGNQAIATRYGLTDGVGAVAATIHTGNIYSISYANRLLRIRSKSKMGLLSNLKWQPPVQNNPWDLTSANWSNYGSFLFNNSINLGTTQHGSIAFINVEEAKTRWDCYGYFLGTYFGPNGYLSVNGYGTLAGRGTVSIYGDTGGEERLYYWAGTNAGGTNFYDAFTPIKMSGSFLGTYIGTIKTDEEAKEYGYPNVTAAEGSKVNGSVYGRNISRLKLPGTLTGSYLHFAAPMTISGSPREVFQLLIYGAMVTPLFTSADVDSTTIAETGTVTAYSALSKKISVGDNDSPLDGLKDLFNSTNAIFSVNTSNKLEYRAYGPRNLNQSIPSFGTSDILSSEFSNDEEDYYNRFIVNYAWSSVTERFGSTYEEKGPSWALGYDRPLVINSKWVYNPNEAVVLTQRTKAKYGRTFPHINFQTNLNRIGMDLGTLLSITDPNAGLSAKVVQITGYEKSWVDRTITWKCFDGEALYQRRGYAFWGTKASLPGDAVSSNSQSGWCASGTCNGINTTIFGTVFNWW